MVKFFKVSKLRLNDAFTVASAMLSCFLNDNLGTINELVCGLADVASYLADGFKGSA